MVKRTIAFILNILTVILEVWGLFLALKDNLGVLMMYTDLSNIFVLITALMFIYDFIKGDIKEYTKRLRYYSAVCITLTFIVVVFVLIPSSGFNFGMLYEGAFLFQHLLCPLICIISFIFFEEGTVSLLQVINSLFPTLLYGLVMIALNIAGLVKGPYPFLMVTRNPWYISIIWAFVIIGISLFIASVIRKSKNWNG